MTINAKQEILKLKNNESWTWPESDYGKAEIWLMHGMYFLFEIPSFGGEPRYVDTYIATTLPDLIATVEKWT